MNASKLMKDGAVALTAVAAIALLAGPGRAAAEEAAAGARPTIAKFVLPRSVEELTVPVTEFKANGAAGYLVTRTPIAPPASAEGWTPAPPKTLTAEEPGVCDYYAWAKDAAGNVSLCAEQTVDVKTTRITVGPKDRGFTNFADAIEAIAKKGNPKGCVIEADAGEYPSWRAENEYKDKGNFVKNIIKVTADNLTIRGVGGRAHLAYKCRGPDSERRWTIPPGGTLQGAVISGSQHGSVMVQAARNLRLENLEVSGGCDANGGSGSGLWVEAAGAGTVVRNCFFHHNDDGILTGKVPGSRVVILNSEFLQNGAPAPFDAGQHHNLYIGEVAELVFMFNYSHSSFRGQLLKSRAGRNYVLYNRLTDEDDSNYPIDLPYGGESYVIGNLVHMSKTNRCATFMNYGREVVMDFVYKNGGPEILRDGAEITNARTGKKHRVLDNFNYGAAGKWENRDRASHCNARLTEADGPDFRPEDKLTYGKESSIELVEANWKWSSPKREIYVCSNTFVNECSSGYGQYLLRAHIDTKVADIRNNLIIDLKPAGNPYKLLLDAAKSIREKAVTEAGNCWATADPGFADLAKYDYALTAKAAAAIDKGETAGGINGMSLRPDYEYVHPCAGRPRPDDGRPDLGAYELGGEERGR